MVEYLTDEDVRNVKIVMAGCKDDQTVAMAQRAHMTLAVSSETEGPVMERWVKRPLSGRSEAKQSNV